MDKSDQAKKNSALPNYMPARFFDEVERPENGVSDVITPAAIELCAADQLRDFEAWASTCGKSSSPESKLVDQLLENDSFRLAMALVSMSDDRETMACAIGRITDAFQVAKHAAKASPECAGHIERLTGLLLSGCFEVVKSLALAAHARQNKSMRPLAEAHAAKSAAVERAKSIATELWQADTAQEIRLGDMADRIYRTLVAEGFADSLPGSAERIKEWIRPAAPEYARKGGRRRKTP